MFSDKIMRRGGGGKGGMRWKMEDTQPSDISPQTSKRAAARMLQRDGCQTEGATHEPPDGLPE